MLNFNYWKMQFLQGEKTKTRVPDAPLLGAFYWGRIRNSCFFFFCGNRNFFSGNRTFFSGNCTFFSENRIFLGGNRIFFDGNHIFSVETAFFFCGNRISSVEIPIYRNSLQKLFYRSFLQTFFVTFPKSFHVELSIGGSYRGGSIGGFYRSGLQTSEELF